VEAMNDKSVFCDTSFFIRLLDKSSELHNNAKGYFKYFSENDYKLLVSTIAVAEYCVSGDLSELPLRNLQIVPFNLDHAKRTAEFARIVFQNKGTLKLNSRNIIPNDTKLFSQADCNGSVKFYISSDTESFKVYDLLKRETNLKFQFIDIKVPHSEVFGLLDL
jgi:hypothetical protein